MGKVKRRSLEKEEYNIDEISCTMINEMKNIGYDGNLFADNLVESVKFRQKRGKNNRKIRYFHYCLWARNLYEDNIGSEDVTFSYPSIVLGFIRSICQGILKGEIRDDAYSVDIIEFCES